MVGGSKAWQPKHRDARFPRTFAEIKMTMPTEQAAQRRRSKSYDRPLGTPEDREFVQRAVYYFPDQEVLDGLDEELRQHREHLAWLESDGHSPGQTASALRKKIEQLEEQIETLRATGRIP
jgi:vacuolar-type H+-ATPase subunit I/STV1